MRGHYQFHYWLIPKDGKKVSGTFLRKIGKFGLRVFWLQRLDGVGDDLGDGQVAEPFLICRDNEPGSGFGAAAAEDGFVGFGVVFPVFAFFQVFRVELPVFIRIVTPGIQPLQLLVFADVEKELQDGDVVFRKNFFKCIDLVVTARPDVLVDQIMDSHDENVFVMRTVEDTNVASGRDCSVDAPKIIVSQFTVAGSLEGGYMAALGVNSREDVANGAVLAPCVHGLKDNEQRLAAICIKNILQFSEPSDGFLQLGHSLIFVGVISGETGIVPGEVYLATGRNDETFMKVHC